MHLCIKHLQQSQNKSSLPQSQNKLNEIILTEREKKKKISNVKLNQHVSNRFSYLQFKRF